MRFHHHVQHRPILDIGARADANPVDVATNHDARPDTRVLANRNVADNHRVGVDVGRRRYFRCSAAVTANHARTPREIKQVKLTHAPAADKEGQVKLDQPCRIYPLDPPHDKRLPGEQKGGTLRSTQPTVFVLTFPRLPAIFYGFARDGAFLGGMEAGEGSVRTSPGSSVFS